MTVGRLGRTIWRTYGGRGLQRRALHELLRASGAYKARPVAADVLPGVAPPAGARLASHVYAPLGDFGALTPEVCARIVARADRVVGGEYEAFGHDWRPFPGDAAGWQSAPGRAYCFPDGSWWTVPHLPRETDIKDAWEPARFGWVYDLVRAHHLTSDRIYAACFAERVSAWCAAAPPFGGVHWSCGQEVAIRAVAVLHGEAAFLDLGGPHRAEVARLLAWSAERIDDAIGYGLSQRNNHGISEAAGLVHLGLRFAGRHPAAARWLARGRRLLDEQVRDQFLDDGWYAQHSFVYLRVALDQALLAQRALAAAGLSLTPAALARLGAATSLLEAVVDEHSGRVPNYGANDGSRVLPLSSAAYGDFRPALTLAAVVLGRPLPADLAPDPEVLAWLGAAPPAVATARSDGVRVGRSSGWVAVRHQGAAAFLRAGEFRHRPSHLDLLHLDLRFDGRETIADPGTFAYNAPPPWNNGLAAAALHNAPVLDGEEPVERGPRFLWQDWPTARLVEAGPCTGGARVVAEVPGRVRREVTFGDGQIVVRDRVLDPAVRAVQVTWLLHPDVGTDVVDAESAITVVARPDAVDAWYSSSYGARVPSRAVRVRRERQSGEPLELVARLHGPAAGAGR